jgi:hypothetical protein
MFKAKHLLPALIAVAFSAFANASILEAPATAQYELSQDPIDLGVQSANDNSFELVAAHNDLSASADYGKEMKPNRTTNKALMLTSEGAPLTLINEVGWRRSYNL